MKKLFLGIFIFANIAVAADISPVGIWMVNDEDAKIEIYPKGDELEGKIVWLKEPKEKDGSTKKDIKNEDEKLRTREVMGMVFLTGFKKNEKKWTGGKIYDAKSGNTYKAWMELEGEDKLKLAGYIGIPLFSRTEVWKRQTK